jgi:hypothetical protein
VPLICYTPKVFTRATRRIIDQANAIIADLRDQGFDLTLRQLYYQFVSRGLLPNRQSEYKRLGEIINDARLAGEIDWSAIVDRTRNLRTLSTWERPADIVEAASQQFRVDMWAHQRHHVEVWIEKDALVGVIQRVCEDHRVGWFSCRGYTSQSEMWAASQRLLEAVRAGKEPVVIHLGDHDPSGIDMSRDIEDRLNLFMSGELADHEATLTVDRIALTMAQIRRFAPPPNPAKVSDARARAYMARYGRESWELDALNPATLAGLIATAVEEYRDPEQWRRDAAVEAEHRQRLGRVAAELKEAS